MPGARPRPSADALEWWQYAACQGTDPSVFYDADDERGIFRRRRQHDAKAICADCPVRRPCLEWALRTRESHGVWGGMTAEERARWRAGGGAIAQPSPESEE